MFFCGLKTIASIASITAMLGSLPTGGARAQSIPTGGEVRFTETFDDTDFSARGWYDHDARQILTGDAVDGSALECRFSMGARKCSTPSRIEFEASETIYLRFYLKFSDNWVGSQRAYHPHMFHFMTNLDNRWVGPASSHLTTYAEIVDKRVLVGMTDTRNVNPACILRNNDTFVGCNGDFASYTFTEQRSVSACNGETGTGGHRDCFQNGSEWYSHRSWRSSIDAFGDGPAPYDKGSWHLVEVYHAMNSIQNGIGIADGKLMWVQDGVVLVNVDDVLYRTGANPTAQFDKFMIGAYIGDGSPIQQSFFIDELVVATAKPEGIDLTPPVPPAAPIILEQ